MTDTNKSALSDEECQKCGDVLPKGKYCKLRGCPLNPAILAASQQSAAAQQLITGWEQASDGTMRSHTGNTFHVANCTFSGINADGATMFELRSDGTLHVHLDGFELLGPAVQRGCIVDKNGNGEQILVKRSEIDPPAAAHVVSERSEQPVPDGESLIATCTAIQKSGATGEFRAGATAILNEVKTYFSVPTPVQPADAAPASQVLNGWPQDFRDVIKSAESAAHRLGRAEGIEEAARKAKSFLVGDPANGVPLRSPMPHEIADAIRALAHKPASGEA